MDTQHTPGPWQLIQADTERVEIDTQIVKATGIIGMGNYGKRLTYTGHDITESEFIANLKLIAAAPELLGALIDLLARVDERCGGRAAGFNSPLVDACDKARAVIAKARGAA